MNDRASSWSVTINNPKDSDEEAIALARQKGWKVEGQLEKGESGTLHYQLFVRTPQVRFSAMKKAFPRAHIEIAKSTSALRNYVNKEETRVAPLKEANDKFPSLSKFWDLIFFEISQEIGGPADQWNPKKTSILEMFDTCVSNLIVKGFYVESMGVNPQIRSAFQKYWPALEIRSNIFADRQTDRQDIASETPQINLPLYINAIDEEGSSPSVSSQGTSGSEDL